jgi:hypothetical protein
MAAAGLILHRGHVADAVRGDANGCRCRETLKVEELMQRFYEGEGP